MAARTAENMNRLKIIHSLKCANYSLAAILRLLDKLSYDPKADIKKELVDDFIWPTLKAGGKYEGYLLGTSFARPVIAKRIVEIAKKEKLSFHEAEERVITGTYSGIGFWLTHSGHLTMNGLLSCLTGFLNILLLAIASLTRLTMMSVHCCK